MIYISYILGVLLKKGYSIDDKTIHRIVEDEMDEVDFDFTKKNNYTERKKKLKPKNVVVRECGMIVCWTIFISVLRSVLY